MIEIKFRWSDAIGYEFFPSARNNDMFKVPSLQLTVSEKAIMNSMHE
jgi:hypothetical protein